MSLEIAIRFRCNKCGVALEPMPIGGNIHGFPLNVQFTISSGPPGWTARGQEVLCPEHSRLVESVTVVPHGIIAAGNGGRR